LSQGGRDLGCDAEGPEVVEASTDPWRGDPDIAPMLRIEVGAFSGGVGEFWGAASWHNRPNGHPVLRAPP